MKEFFANLHLTLLKFRVLQVSLSVFLCWTIYQIIMWICAVPYGELTDWQLAPVAGAFMALVQGFLSVVKLSVQPRDLDPEEMK